MAFQKFQLFKKKDGKKFCQVLLMVLKVFGDGEKKRLKKTKTNWLLFVEKTGKQGYLKKIEILLLYPKQCGLKKNLILLSEHEKLLLL